MQSPIDDAYIKERFNDPELRWLDSIPDSMESRILFYAAMGGFHIQLNNEYSYVRSKKIYDRDA